MIIKRFFLNGSIGNPEQYWILDTGLRISGMTAVGQTRLPE
jgi:hypothetical protein